MIQKNGASEGIRTLDIHVGNVTLYQTELRSLPTASKTTTVRELCKLFPNSQISPIPSAARSEAAPIGSPSNEGLNHRRCEIIKERST